MTKDEIIADVNLGSYATTAQMNTGLSSKQNTDATLTALANLTTAADQIPYATGADAFAMTPLTPFARTLLDDANAAAALATLGAAPVVSPALTGTPTAPTATSGTSTTQLATTAFVVAEMANSRPYEVTASSIKMNGAQSVGLLNTVARADHIHPTDTSRVAKSGDTMTGQLKTRYTNDWVGFVADNPTEGKITYFEGQVNGIARGGMQVVPAASGAGEYFTSIRVTPAGATNIDRRVGGLDVYANGLFANAYGWLHDKFAAQASPALTGTPTAPTASTGTRSTQLATTAFVGAECTLAAPIGSVYTFAGATVPTGWLKCNGALLSRTTYAALFAVIGTTYGAGDGSTTFALPDLRGEFVRGVDDGRGVDAGRTLGSAQAATRVLRDWWSDNGAGKDALAWNGSAVVCDYDGSTERVIDAFGPTWNGAKNPDTWIHVDGVRARPRNVAMHYIIKY